MISGRITRGTYWKQPDWAKCNRCGGTVYSVAVDEPYSETDRDELGNRMTTGETIITIICHGEKWQWSSWYGPNDPWVIELVNRIPLIAHARRAKDERSTQGGEVKRSFIRDISAAIPPVAAPSIGSVGRHRWPVR